MLYLDSLYGFQKLKIRDNLFELIFYISLKFFEELELKKREKQKTGGVIFQVFKKKKNPCSYFYTIFETHKHKFFISFSASVFPSELSFYSCNIPSLIKIHEVIPLLLHAKRDCPLFLPLKIHHILIKIHHFFLCFMSVWRRILLHYWDLGMDN